MVRASKLLLTIVLLLNFSRPSSAQSSIDSIINATACRQIVETLAADSFLGRHSGTPKAEQAARYIADQFSKAGCVPGTPDKSFFIPFPITWDGEKRITNNVMAVLPGKSKPNEWVLFSAHYDHVGTTNSNILAAFMPEKGKPEKGDSIYNGANDNASGTSALILLARYFASQNNNERTLVFIAFSGEEMGLLGSQFTAGMFTNHDSITAMINMDMLGVPISRRKKNPIITGAEHSDLKAILNKTLFDRSPQLYGSNYFHDDPFKNEHLFRRSDNYSFAVKGVPAHTIIATHPRNRYYHSLNDEPVTLNYELLAKNIRALAIGSGTLADGTRAPSRINPLTIKQ